jgi:hypothetical protein
MGNSVSPISVPALVLCELKFSMSWPWILAITSCSQREAIAPQIAWFYTHREPCRHETMPAGQDSQQRGPVEASVPAGHFYQHIKDCESMPSGQPAREYFLGWYCLRQPRAPASLVPSGQGA